MALNLSAIPDVLDQAPQDLPALAARHRDLVARLSIAVLAGAATLSIRRAIANIEAERSRINAEAGRAEAADLAAERATIAISAERSLRAACARHQHAMEGLVLPDEPGEAA